MIGGRLVRKDRSGQRDILWLLRQRLYGEDAPFCDIDTILVYDNRKPVGLFEDVNEHGVKLPGRDPSIAAVRTLAQPGRVLPFFLRTYADDFSWISVRNLNAYACGFTPARIWPTKDFGSRLTELEYMVWRHWIGGRPITLEEAGLIYKKNWDAGRHIPDPRGMADALARLLEKLDQDAFDQIRDVVKAEDARRKRAKREEL